MNKPGRPPSILLPQPWSDLLDRSQDRYERVHLRKFMSFCADSGISPEQVSDHAIAAFEIWAWKKAYPRPRQAAREAALTWNEMKQRFVDWPGEQLTIPNYMGWQACDPTELPKSFSDDVNAFLDRATAQDIFDEAAPIAALSPVTRRDRANKIYQLATHALNSGLDASRLTSLGTLVTPEIYQPIVLAIWNRADKRTNAHSQNLVRVLSLIARHWANSPLEDIQKLKQIERKMRPSEKGMTQTNWERLRPFIVPATTSKLINLPLAILDKLDTANPTLADALLAQSSLAVSIELIAPLRVKNLAALDLTRHLQWVENSCFLVIPASEVKNNRDLQYELQPVAIKVLNTYLNIYRPLLVATGPDNAKIFISRSGSQKRPDQLSTQITAFLREHLGLRINIHLFRHLAAYLFLRAYPGEYESVRQFLGHKSTTTTTSFYTGLEQLDTNRRYDAILDKYREQSAETK